MVIAMGTVCLAAAWIMTASNPYTDLAHRVSDVPEEPATVEAEPIPLFEVATTAHDGLPMAAEEPVPSVPVVGVEDSSPEPLSPAVAARVPPRLPIDQPKVTDIGELEFGRLEIGEPDRLVDLIGPVLPTGIAQERGLALSDVERRAVQRRLGMIGFDLGTPDGIFGSRTRDAIDRFQVQGGLIATGYLDEVTLALLIDETEAEYAAWAESLEGRQSRRAYRQRSDTRLAAAPVPARRGAGEPGECRRKADGSVLGRQSLGCDLRGFGEGLRGVFTGNLGPSGPAQLEGLADPDR